MRRVVYFSSRFFREMKKLVKKAPDLPAEVLRVLPLIDSGDLKMEEVTASSSRSWVHHYFRLGSRAQSMGKREGYRVHVIIGKTEMRLYTIHMGHHQREFISEDDKRAIRKALEEETVSDLATEWFTRDDLVEVFINRPDLGDSS